jgi:DNA-binding HxlR family transcriptional regulator
MSEPTQHPTNDVCRDTAFNCVVKIIGDPWILHIVRVLMIGEMRFSELSVRVPGVTARTLSTKLKLLQEKKLLTRTSYDQIPPKVVYKLTDTGLELSQLINNIEKFGVDNFGWCR